MNKIVLEPELLFPIVVCDRHLEGLEVVGEAEAPCSKCQIERRPRPRMVQPAQAPDPTVRDWGDRDDIIREMYRGQGI